MRLRTPSFWYDTTSHAAKAKANALSSLCALYAAGHVVRQKMTPPRKAHLPVICVGNAVAGGSGKTPVALALMDLVREINPATNPCFLTRGYGGTLRGPALVDPARHIFTDTGDEPLLLAAKARTIVSRDRYEGAMFAKDQGCDLVIMDDGLQNPGLVKDFSILVVDGASGFGNEMLLPAGPLRVPVRDAMRKADAVLILGSDAHHIAGRVPADKPCLRAALHVEKPSRPATSYYGFCGIGQPGKFRASLAEAGLDVRGFKAYPDHYEYTSADLFALAQEANTLSARLITTAKDAVRLPEAFIRDNSVDILSRRFEWENSSEQVLRRLLQPLMP